MYVLVNNVCEGKSLQRFAHTLSVVATYASTVCILADLVCRKVNSYVCICCSLSEILMSAVEPMTVSKSVLANAEGSFEYCVCESGFTLDADGKGCKRIFRFNSDHAFITK